MNPDDVFRKGSENDLKMEKDKPVATNKPIDSLDRFVEDLKKYRKVVIQIEYFEPDHACGRIEFNGEEVARYKNAEEYRDNIISLLAECHIDGRYDGYMETTFYFHDGRRIICIFCFKD